MKRASPLVREHWRQVVQRQRSSGLSVARYCRERGIGPSSLFAWKRRLAGELEATAGAAFIAITPATERGECPASSASPGAIELHLGGGRHLLLRPGFDGPTLAAAWAVLAGGEGR
jgi:transposase-like protein